jgi:hypothetical protein
VRQCLISGVPERPLLVFSAVARRFWGAGLGNGISNFGHRHRKMLHLPKQVGEDLEMIFIREKAVGAIEVRGDEFGIRVC